MRIGLMRGMQRVGWLLVLSKGHTVGLVSMRLGTIILLVSWEYPLYAIAGGRKL